MLKRKERERGKGKEERGRLPTEERCEWWPVMTPTGRFHWEGRERRMVGTGGKKKGQSRYKKCNRLRVHKKNIIFYIKSWFSDFIKLGSQKYIFAKWPHQNTNSEIFFLNNYFFIYKMSYYLNKNMKGLIWWIWGLFHYFNQLILFFFIKLLYA